MKPKQQPPDDGASQYLFWHHVAMLIAGLCGFNGPCNSILYNQRIWCNSNHEAAKDYEPS